MQVLKGCAQRRPPYKLRIDVKFVENIQLFISEVYEKNRQNYALITYKLIDELEMFVVNKFISL
jgi:hypothetical protein